MLPVVEWYGFGFGFGFGFGRRCGRGRGQGGGFQVVLHVAVGYVLYLFWETELLHMFIGASVTVVRGTSCSV